MQSTKVVPIPVLGKRNVNAYLLIGRKPVLVDAGVPESATKIIDGITASGVHPADISLIVITHAHLDHFGSAAAVHDHTAAPIAAHADDLEQYIEGRAREPYFPTGPLGRLLASQKSAHTPTTPFRPQLVVDGETPLHDYGIDARIMPTPGHTAGSISVLTDHGDLVAGDLVATSFLGVSRARPANPPFHDDPVANLASLRRMLALKPARLHVGHGGPLDPDRVARWAAKEERRLARRPRPVRTHA